MGFEPTTPVFEQAKTFRTGDRATAVMGLFYYDTYKFIIAHTQYTPFRSILVLSSYLRLRLGSGLFRSDFPTKYLIFLARGSVSFTERVVLGVIFLSPPQTCRGTDQSLPDTFQFICNPNIPQYTYI
jgi:hypothetical protein